MPCALGHDAAAHPAFVLQILFTRIFVYTNLFSMSSTNKNAEANAGPFLRLPPELRLVVYEQMFPPDEIRLEMIGGNLHVTKRAQQLAGSYVAILATCRVLYAEGKPVLYNNTEFRILVGDRDAQRVRIWEKHLKQKCSRSSVSINDVRKLSLEVAVNRSAETRQTTWTERFKQILRTATAIQNLHITLTVRSHEYDQEETDHTLRVIAETVQCNGAVTADLDYQLGSPSIGFKPAGYYRMLAGYAGQVPSAIQRLVPRR